MFEQARLVLMGWADTQSICEDFKITPAQLTELRREVKWEIVELPLADIVVYYHRKEIADALRRRKVIC